MIFIYRTIDAGMVNMTDVLNGNISLAEIVRVNLYLDMKQDIEFMASEEARKHGNSKRIGH
jgi:hypothetical protein